MDIDARRQQRTNPIGTTPGRRFTQEFHIAGMRVSTRCHGQGCNIMATTPNGRSQYPILFLDRVGLVGQARRDLINTAGRCRIE